MKQLRLLMALACMAFVATAFGQKIKFSDKSGEMTLANIDNWSTRLTSPDTLHFRAMGNKLSGTWTNLGIAVTSRSIEGDAKRIGSTLSLQKATLTGGVHVTVRRPKQIVDTDSSKANITSEGDQMVIHLEGGVVIDSRSLQTSETMHATGSSGNARITPTTGLGRATLRGPVAVEMTRKDVKGITRITSHSDRLDIDKMTDPATITLVGNVTLLGNDPVIAGDIRASRAVITLDANGQPVGMDAEGDPGVMKFKEKGGAP